MRAKIKMERGKHEQQRLKNKTKHKNDYLEKVRSSVKIRIILERKSADLKRKIFSKC